MFESLKTLKEGDYAKDYTVLAVELLLNRLTATFRVFGKDVCRHRYNITTKTKHHSGNHCVLGRHSILFGPAVDRRYGILLVFLHGRYNITVENVPFDVLRSSRDTADDAFSRHRRSRCRRPFHARSPPRTNGDRDTSRTRQARCGGRRVSIGVHVHTDTRTHRE